MAVVTAISAVAVAIAIGMAVAVAAAVSRKIVAWIPFAPPIKIKHP